MGIAKDSNYFRTMSKSVSSCIDTPEHIIIRQITSTGTSGNSKELSPSTSNNLPNIELNQPGETTEAVVKEEHSQDLLGEYPRLYEHFINPEPRNFSEKHGYNRICL